MATDDLGALGNQVFGSALGVASILKWVFLGLIVLALLVVIIFKLKNKKRYIYKTEVWGTVGGVPDVMQFDKARPISVRTKEGVNSLLFFKKMKRYIKIPNRLFFIGKKIRFWFRQDGELTPIKPIGIKFYDFKKGAIEGKRADEIMKQARDNEEIFCPLMMEDINEKFAVMKVKFINEDARLSHVSTGKIIREMFTINKFLKEHGATILMILGVIAIAFSVILILDAMKSYNDGAGSVATSTAESTKELRKLNEGTILLVDKIDNMLKENRGYQNVQCSPPTNSS